MPDLQAEALKWVAAQPAITGAALLGAGVVYAFFGFLVFRFLLVLTCAGLGWLAAMPLCSHMPLPPLVAPACAALALGALAAKWEKAGIAICALGIWGTLSYYLTTQLALPMTLRWMATGTAGGLGILFALICPRGTRVILPALVGAVLMVLGFVGATTHLLPAIGNTFRRWAASRALVAPILLTMLFVTAYSYQAMRARGDIKTGR